MADQIGASSGNAQTGDVRVNKTFSNDTGPHTGTLVDNGNGPTVNPSTSTQTLTAGIYDTAITVNPVTGTATDFQVLTGYEYSSAAGINRTGAMPNNGSVVLQPGTSGSPGYYSNVSAAADVATGTANFDATGKLQVTGLAFTPSRVVINEVSGTNGLCLFDSSQSTTNYTVNGGMGSSVTYTTQSGGFTIQATTNYANVSNQRWIALK